MSKTNTQKVVGLTSDSKVVCLLTSPLRYILFIAIALVSGGLKAQTLPDTLSLQQFLTLATEYNLEQQRAKLVLDSSQLSYRIFQSSLKPQLFAFANVPNFQRTFSETTQPDGTIQFQPINYNNSYATLQASQRLASTGGVVFAQSDLQRFDDFQNNFNQYNGIPLRVGIQQPLFAFNPFKWSKQIQPLRLLQSEKQYNFNVERIKNQAVALFSDLMLVYNELQIATTNEQSIQNLFDIAKERFELGEISERDLIQLELELVSAQRSRRSAAQQVRSISIDVATFLRIEPNDQLVIPRLPEVKTTLTVDEQAAISELITNRAEVIGNQIEQIQADRGLDFAKKNNGFQMDIRASVGWAGSSMQAEDIYTKARDEQAFQVQLNIPILDWGQRRDQIKIATKQKEFTQYKAQQDKLALQANVRQIVQQFLNLQREVELAAKIQQLATKRYEISKESYLLGAIGLTELTLSQREKDSGDRQYIQTLTQYWQSYYLLRLNTLYDFEKGEKITY